MQKWTAACAEAERRADAMAAEIDRIFDELGGAVDVRSHCISFIVNLFSLSRLARSCHVYIIMDL